MLRIASVLCGLLIASNSVWAENWPNWRGPLNNGVSHEKNLPVEWSETEHVAWKIPLPGPAGSTPVVWDDHIFLTSMDNAGSGKDAYLLAYDTTGKELWRQKLGTGTNKPRGDEGNNIAAPSPVTDGEHVWGMASTGDLYCCDF
ncbi:MAG: PQQ-binding-like beta-propeller repeat protein, partial [Planctomycetes bacterium]|nr:PQQ-binding-like beta-propeller repeat protein [Planctomycetota bacterium]